MKKLFVTLLSLLCVAACAFVFAACGGNPDGGLDDGNKPPHTITKVTVDKSTLAMEVDEMEVLAATILPQNATNKKIRWISSDELADTYVVAFDIIQVEGGYSDYDGNNFNENGDVIIGVVAVGAGNTKIAAVSEEIYDVGYISDGNGGFTLDQERLKKINMEVSAILNGEVIDEKINNEIRDRIACCEVTVTEESDKERNGIVYSPNDEHGYDKHYIVKSVDNTLDTPVVIQSEFNGKPVRAIKAEAFKDCSLIPSITIPDSVTRIEQDAFSGCAALTSITIPDSVTYIGEGALSGCTSLTSITMPYVSRLSNIFAENVPASLKTVVITSGYGGYAFKGCSGLTSITLPNGITQIGPQMFADCTSLAEINIPDSVTYIGEDAFSGCTSLASIKVGADNTEFVSQNGILYNKEKTRIILVPEGIAGAVSIANSVTEISGDYLFRNCGLITSIIIPASVAKIDNVFWWCSSLESITVSADNTVYASQDGILYNKEKTELILAPKAIKGAVVIPSGVTTISGYAFSGCSLLTSVTIPSSVETIKFGAFSGCDSLASMTLSLETEFIDSYNRVSNKFGCIFGGTGFGDWGENGAVPSSLKTIVISGGCNILDQMFYNCREITSVTISNSVTFIGYEAFSGCINLAEINGANNVATIMDGAFANTAFLNSMLNQSDDIVYWGTKLFMAKSDITECAIEDGTTSIMPHAFKGSSLTSITIPASVVSIGMSAFADCKDLQTITFEPDSQLETVGGYAFSGCSALRTVVIPEGVTVIWVGTIEGCTSLQTVGAPIDGITYI
ncbi:MAG: leucine-rich repeat protein, partial [Clostridiales bacterium]|nr:leucine-rich repeat protein [Clostridiales bacterium]